MHVLESVFPSFFFISYRKCYSIFTVGSRHIFGWKSSFISNSVYILLWSDVNAKNVKISCETVMITINVRLFLLFLRLSLVLVVAAFLTHIAPSRQLLVLRCCDSQLLIGYFSWSGRWQGGEIPSLLAAHKYYFYFTVTHSAGVRPLSRSWLRVSPCASWMVSKSVFIYSHSHGKEAHFGKMSFKDGAEREHVCHSDVAH